jgi:branched-chain amino acid aminotransferase
VTALFDQVNELWLNGKTVSWDDANVHISTHSLHLGSGIFEAIRCYETDTGPALFRMDAHLERFYSSAKAHQIKIPFTKRTLENAICETIQRNKFSNCYVRLLGYYGSGSFGIYPYNCPVEIAVMALPFSPYLNSEVKETGLRVHISSWRKFNSLMMPISAKACGQYVNSILALTEAISNGYDEALLLDINGNIAEGSGENIFLVRDGTLITNDEQSSILLGITRDTVIRIAHDLGYRVEIRILRPDDLFAADEAFFTGTAVEITPIREVNGKKIGSYGRGTVTKKIQQVFLAAVSGNDKRYESWLYHINS